MLKVLVIEPYHGGSHRAFLGALMRGLPYEFTLMAMPARKWKWRMRLSAPHFATALGGSGQRYDRILCSTFLDVAAFRGLAPAWVRDVPVLTYFHENQFDYPAQAGDERDFHFALTNVTTALASDAVAFNSGYNMQGFLCGLDALLKHATDMSMTGVREAIMERSRVIHPCVELGGIDAAAAERRESGSPPIVLWNHRWEHDKNPSEFFDALHELDARGVDFGLIVLGQAFERRPEVFEEARRRLAHRLVHFGYARGRNEYERLIARADVVVSTALHEFFGISVIEAVRAGCRPLLPRRLSYPELFPDEYLYDASLANAIERAMSAGRLESDLALALTERFSSATLMPEYARWIEGARVLK